MASPSGISGESCSLAIRSSPRPLRSAIRVAELFKESVEMKERNRERRGNSWAYAWARMWPPTGLALDAAANIAAA